MRTKHSGRRRPPVSIPRRTPGQAWWLVVAVALTSVFLTLRNPANAQEQDISIRSLAFDRGWVSLTWAGGRPPYRVQIYTDTLARWLDLSDFVFDNRFDGAAMGEVAWFRVRSAEDKQAPTPPSGLKLAALRCHAAALTWLATQDDLAGSGLGSYRVYRNGVMIAELPAEATVFLDRAAQPGTVYEYSITAVDRVGNESAQVSAISVTTPLCLGASGPATEVRLAWDASEDPDVSGYVVHWGVRPGEYLWALDNLDSTSVTIGGLQPCTAYFFAVRTYDDDGESGYSEEIAHITPEFSESVP